MTPVCSAYDRPRENQTGLAVRPVANVALDTDRAITEGECDIHVPHRRSSAVDGGSDATRSGALGLKPPMVRTR